MRARSYYQLLLVDPAADLDIISVVYRRLAKRYHPDVDPGPEAQERMLEINEAWSTLQDPDRRQRYDTELALRRDRRASDRFVRRTAPLATDPATGRPMWGEAGPPPPGPASGQVLDFGRYRGWTIGQIARRDRDFLEWLQRHPSGRQFRVELTEVLARSAR